MENSKILMTESTKQVFDELVTEDLESMDPHEVVRKINATKKLVAKLTESGEIEVKMLLLD